MDRGRDILVVVSHPRQTWGTERRLDLCTESRVEVTSYKVISLG